MRAATVCAAVLTLAATFAVEARTPVRGTSARSAASSRAAAKAPAKTSAKAPAQHQNPYRRSPYVGALVFVKPADPLSVQPGDPITYLIAENPVVTYRVTEVLPDGDDPSVARCRQPRAQEQHDALYRCPRRQLL